MKTKRPRHLFKSRTRTPNAGELFKLAMEETEIQDCLSQANLPNCMICSMPSAGLAIWHPLEAGVSDYDGPSDLGCPLCQPCKDRSDSDTAFREIVLRKSLALWDRPGLKVIFVKP